MTLNIIFRHKSKLLRKDYKHQNRRGQLYTRLYTAMDKILDPKPLWGGCNIDFKENPSVMTFKCYKGGLSELRHTCVIHIQ